ncbi:MAG: sigma-70 family RNA polymerase sigma factor [Planctomycetota bacterium]
MAASEQPRTRGASVAPLVDHLFRRQYGRMVAGLARVFGSDLLDLAEDVVQEALVRALRVWPFEGVPREPEAWLVQVARNLALDVLRRRSMTERKLRELEGWADSLSSHGTSAPVLAEVGDDTLAMMFMCCHPSLSPEARVALTLKTLAGFGVAEIARALLAKEATVAQRLTRAKAHLQREGATLALPAADRLPRRLDSVLEVVYLLFNEGYSAAQGENLVRAELVHEAIRLGRLVLSTPQTALPKVHALLALLSFLAARLPARTDAVGEPLTLPQQDRSLWDRQLLASGFEHFARSMAGDEISAFHLEAAIASCHAAAPTYEATDWPTIRHRYDQLLDLIDSPVVRLNRAVAIAKVEGLVAALAELDDLRAHGTLAGYYLLPATHAQFLWSAGRRDEARAAFAAALACPCSIPEREFLRRRAQACERGEPAPRI